MKKGFTKMLGVTMDKKLILRCCTIMIPMIMVTTVSQAQDVKYFDKQGRETVAAKGITSEKVVSVSDNRQIIIRQKKNGDTLSVITCSSLSPVTREGITRIFYDSGALHYSKLYRNNQLEGESRRYYEDGRIMSIFTFAGDSLVIEKSYDPEGNALKHIPYRIPAKFKDKDFNAFRIFIAQNVRYPQFNDIGYKVSEQCPVSFLIDRDGNITDIQMHTVIPQFREEIIRIMKLTEGKWTPAEAFGEPVPMRCTTRIDFNAGG